MSNDYADFRRQTAAHSQAASHAASRTVVPSGGRYDVSLSQPRPVFAFLAGLALGGLLGAAAFRLIRI